MSAVTGCKSSLAGTFIVDQRGTKKFEDTQINLQVNHYTYTKNCCANHGEGA